MHLNTEWIGKFSKFKRIILKFLIYQPLNLQQMFAELLHPQKFNTRYKTPKNERKKKNILVLEFKVWHLRFNKTFKF